MDRLKFYTGIQILKNAVQAFDLLSRIGEDQIFQSRFFIFPEVVDKQIKIFIKRRLGFNIEKNGFISLVEELLSKFQQIKIPKLIAQHFLVCKIKPGIDPLLVLLFILSGQGFPEFYSFFISALHHIECEFHIFKPDQGIRVNIFKQGNIMLGQEF